MICPNCGYSLKDKKMMNFSPLINKLLSEKGESTRNTILQILKVLSDYKKISAKDIYFFLKNIESIDEKVIRFSINQFYNSGKYKSTSLQYLKSIIVNNDKGKEKLISVEKKLYGTKPPEREVE